MKEVNTSLKEAADAARVPEAEHIRLETGANTKPALPAAKTSDEEPPAAADAPAVLNLAGGVSAPAAGSDGAADGQPVPAAAIVPAKRDLPAAGDAPSIDPRSTPQIIPASQAEPFNQPPSLDSSDQPAGEPLAEEALPSPDLEAAPAMLSTVDETPAAPPKRAYRKRAAQVNAEAAPGSDPAAQPLAEPSGDSPALRKRASRKAQAEQAAAGAESPQAPAAVETEPAAPAKRAYRKRSAAAAQEPAPDVVQPPLDSPEDAEPQPRKRTVRKRSPETAGPVSEESHSTPAPAPKKSAGRKPRAAEAVEAESPPVVEHDAPPVLLPAPETPVYLPEPPMPVLLAAPAEEPAGQSPEDAQNGKVKPAPRKRAARSPRATTTESQESVSEPDGSPEPEAKPRKARNPRNTPPADV